MRISVSIEVPDWASYTAFGANGDFYAFENEPTARNSAWFAVGKLERLFVGLCSREDWSDTLRPTRVKLAVIQELKNARD